MIQLDECMVTKKSLPTLSWSKKRTNAEIDFHHFDTKAYAIIGAVSREMGLEHYMIFTKSLNVDRFLIFLEELRAKNPFDDVILMMDNLRVHKSQRSIERMDELGFRYCWTPRYQPQYNGIEEVWAMAK